MIDAKDNTMLAYYVATRQGWQIGNKTDKLRRKRNFI